MQTVSYLIICLCLAAFLQPTRGRREAALAFAFAAGAHALLCREWTGLPYYLGAGACDYMVIAFLFSRPRTPLGCGLVLLSMLSSVGNAFGFFLWVEYQAPLYYNNLFLSIYGTALFLMLTGGLNARRYLEDSYWLPNFRVPDYSLSNLDSQIYREEKLCEPYLNRVRKLQKGSTRGRYLPPVLRPRLDRLDTLS